MKYLITMLFALFAFSAQAASPEVHFSPNGGSQDAIVKEIDSAQKSLYVATYQLTNKHISAAILDAFSRGVKVSLLVDRSQRNVLKGDQYCCAANVAKVIPTYVDTKHAIFHNKVIVVDEKTVITGSFNFSNAAEKSNAENMLIIRDDPVLAGEYIANWYKHQQHAEKY